MGNIVSRKELKEHEIIKLNEELEQEVQRMRRKVKQLDEVIYLASAKLENLRN